jgi:hypothetical protein
MAGGNESRKAEEPGPLTITIQRCPLCGHAHEYDVEVKTSGMMYFEMPPGRQYTRLFTCPDRGGTFQSTITTSGYIDDVTVTGPHQAGTKGVRIQ